MTLQFSPGTVKASSLDVFLIHLSVLNLNLATVFQKIVSKMFPEDFLFSFSVTLEF